MTNRKLRRIWDEAWLDVVNGAPHPGRYQADGLLRALYEQAYRMHAVQERADA